MGPGVCPGPPPLRTSDAGPCGHSASFSHGMVTSRADGSPEEGPCCLRWEGSGVVRASWRRVQSWRREGSQVGREGGAGPPPGRRADVCRHLRAALCPWRRGTCPRAPAQRGAWWGAAGARADIWHLRGVAAWGARRRAAHSVRALPPALGGRCSGRRVLEDRMPGCLSGGGGGGEGPMGFGAETAFAEGHRCVCALHHFEGMPPSSPLFPGGARPSAPVRHSLSPSLVLGPGPPPARSPPSPPSRPPAPTPGRPGVWVSPRRALASRMVAVRRQRVVKAHGVDRMKQRKLKVAW